MKTLVQELPFYKKTSDLFQLYAQNPQAIFLDSSLQNELGRYSIICLNPYLTVKEEDGICYCNGLPCQESFETVMERYLREHREKNPTSLPLIAGAVGYLTYDYGRKFEQISSRHPKKIQMPEAQFTFFDNYLIEDTLEKKLWITAHGEQKKAETSISQIVSQIQNCPEMPSCGRHSHVAPYHPNFQKEEYKRAVDRMISYITEGDIYIANMTQQLTIESKKAPQDVFYNLRKNNPSPFGGYLDFDHYQIVCASPERFLKLTDGHVETRPIKGTRKRGETEKEDLRLRKELENSEKDKSELLMIVDLARNDLNKICRSGSVKVTDLFTIEEYATVFHLVSGIEGDLADEKNFADLLMATFPGGSITGAPKYRAMEVIDELEHGKRNLYTGSIGYLSLDGNCDFNIVIRTVLHVDGHYHLGVGGGITAESETEFEYEETLQKAKAILDALQ